MALPLRYPRLWLVGGWLLIGFAVIASLSPAQQLPHVSGGDKMHHFIAYFSIRGAQLQEVDKTNGLHKVFAGNHPGATC